MSDGWEDDPIPPSKAGPSPEEEAAGAALLRRAEDYEAERPKRKPATPAAPPAHQSLPQAPDAEMGFLGSFLIAPREVGELCQRRRVTGEHFYLPGHAIVFETLLEMWDAGKPIDNITLTQFLHDTKRLEPCGGAAAVSELYTLAVTAANAEYYLDILEEKRVLRATIRVCTAISARCYSEQDNPTGLLDDAERGVLAIRRQRENPTAYTGKDLARLGIESLSRKWERAGQISGLSTSFPDLDLRTDGMHPTELIVLAALPSVGKSALAMNIAEYQAITARTPVGVFPLEMGEQQMADRHIASYAYVNTTQWKYGKKPTEDDLERLRDAAYWYEHSPLFFEGLSDPTIQEMRAIARRWVRDHGVKIIIVDTLTATRSNTKQARENRTREVAEAIEGMKEMAKELKITVIALAHINRELEKLGKDGNPQRPGLADLRESGAIAQAADTVWMLWSPREGQTAIWMPKCRNGERFVSIPMTFEKEFCRFSRKPQEQDTQQQHLL